MNRSIQGHLTAARIAIHNALADETLRTKLAENGCTAQALEAGRMLYEQAVALVQAQQSAYSQQYAATALLNKARQQAHARYLRQRQLAKIAFRENQDAAGELGLRGAIPSAFAQWLTGAEHFYTRVLAMPDYLETLARFGLSQAEIEGGQALMLAVVTARLERDRLQGEARHATQMRNIALRALQRWFADFRVHARFALADTPQYLEKLGIEVPSPEL